MLPLKTSRGKSLPLGVTSLLDGLNFAVFCRHGTSVRLVILGQDDDTVVTEITLDPRTHRTGDHWHILVQGLPAVFRYGWRVDGPRGAGHRFDPDLVLLDPSGIALSEGGVWGQPPRNGHPASDLARRTTHRRSLFVRRAFDWREDAPPLTPIEDSILYEIHVRGFTVHPTSGVAHPGTFAGLVEKIPYLKSLGVTAVELLPVHEFDENDCPFTNPLTGTKLRNFWGYNSIAFAATKAAYAASGPEHHQASEFRDMVRAFHEAGLEVILDVVFNHTGEGDERGRTYSFRGLDNSLYYMVGPGGEYLNFSGCGNTVNCNHPVVRSMIINCLRFWVADMHVDGLRFDLASVFGRDRAGNVLLEPPIVEMIGEDGVLADVKLIAEPWDAVGLYQVGEFPFGRRWSEWNGRFRDDVRRFWRGDLGMTGALASRVCGSSDLYERSGRRPTHSLNFITCHDGFTLWDTVSYNQKHNEANGEDNRDGQDVNFSWNCGVEGTTDDPEVLQLRNRQVRNLLATLMLSQGVPMLLGGDEMLRTQRGNNNAWCQDNDTSWLNWHLQQPQEDFQRFARMLIKLRQNHPALRRRTFFRGAGPSRNLPPDIIWHGVQPYSPDFSFTSRTLAFALDGRYTGREPDHDFYIAMNAWSEPLAFVIPQSPSGSLWRRVIDTSLQSPRDIMEFTAAPAVTVSQPYLMAPFSMIVLLGEKDHGF